MTTPGQYAQELSQRASGPHDDQATAQVAGLIAEAIRYLCYAAAQGGITEPTTIYAVVGELSTAAYRLPQVLTQLARWLTAEADTGRVTSDRPARQLTSEARAIFSEAARHTGSLATTLADAHNLTATICAANRATQATATRSRPD